MMKGSVKREREGGREGILQSSAYLSQVFVDPLGERLLLDGIAFI